MVRSYTRAEMLSHWRLAHGFETGNTGVDIEAFEGLDTSTALAASMRQWYLGLLDTAPVHKLQTTVMKLPAEATSGGIMSRAAIPAGVRRLLYVDSQGWGHGVVPVEPAEAGRRLGRVASPYARPSEGDPMAVVLPGCVEVAPCKAGEIEIRAIVDPGPDVYILDDSLLPVPSLDQ